MNGFSNCPLVIHAFIRLCGTIVPLIERILTFLEPKQSAMVIEFFGVLPETEELRGILILISFITY